MNLIIPQPPPRQVIYWLSFSLCWIVGPLIQGYYDTGAFTFKTRVWASVRFNVIFYIIAGIILASFLIAKAVASQLSTEEVGAFAALLANTWGLLLLVLMLGYGLVEVPRTMWYNGNRVVRMKKMHYTMSNLHENAQVQQDRLSQLHSFVQRVHTSFSTTSPMRQFVDVVVYNTPSPDSYKFAGIFGGNPVEEMPVLDKLKSKPLSELNERDLADLNYLAILAKHELSVTAADWEDTVDEAIELEAITHWQHTATPSSAAPTSVRSKGCLAVNWWRFKVFWSPVVLRVCAVICTIFSLIMMYGEISLVIPTEQQISPLGALLESIQGQIIAQTICLIYLLYIVLCTFFTLFRVRISAMYHMHGGGRTNEVSLIHNGLFMLRVLPALGYNFFHILRVENTAFQKVVGNMDAIPVFGSSFNQYFPIFICVFAVATLFNWFTRVLKCLNIPRFEYSENFDNEHVAEGKLLLSREKRYRDEAATLSNFSSTREVDDDDAHRLI